MGMFDEARRQRAAYQKEHPNSLLKYWDSALNAIPDAAQYFAHGYNFSTPGQVADIATIPQQLAGEDPEKIPGTTEYLRAKAGVRAPETLPEKFGYLGGQVAAPGPGEVAGMLGAGKAILIGARSKMFRKDILQTALNMENAGASRDEIWRETARLGQPQMRDPTDMNWKAEVPFPNIMSEGMETHLADKYHGSWAPPISYRTALGGDLGYGDDLGEQTVDIKPGASGYYQPSAKHMVVGEIGTPTIFAHESAHAVQELENWPRGGSPSSVVKDIKGELDRISYRINQIGYKMRDGKATAEEIAERERLSDRAVQLSWKLTPDAARGAYMKLGGEAAARNDAFRAGWTPEEIAATPWWETLDVPWEEQTIKYTTDGAAADPEKTVRGYKLFRKKKDGMLYPLFINKTEPVPTGEWIDAQNVPTPGFDKRPGWHAGSLPYAPHLRQKSTGAIHPNRQWTEVDMPDDVDWQTRADASPTRDIKGEVPAGGTYRFKRSKKQGKEWLIGGSVRVNKELSDDEIEKILRDAGIEDWYAELKRGMLE